MIFNKSLCRTCTNFGSKCNIFPEGMPGIVVTKCNDFRRGPVNKEFKNTIEKQEKELGDGNG